MKIETTKLSKANNPFSKLKNNKKSYLNFNHYQISFVQVNKIVKHSESWKDGQKIFI